jgi:hypothetical protein
MPKQFTTSTEVQNINGTGSAKNPEYKIPRLKEKYVAMSGYTGDRCSAIDGAEECPGSYQATAHVMINDGKKGGGGNTWWLVPTCAHHNLSVPFFEVGASTIFCSVEEIRDM